MQFWSAILFRASDPHNLTQTPPQFEYKTGVPQIKGYRYPAPGSQPAVNVQNVNSSDEIYDNNYYPRNSNLLDRQVVCVALSFKSAKKIVAGV
jgi:hypothetical protein